MIPPFDRAGSPARIVFGPGVSARAGEMVEALGCRRALVLSTPNQAGDAQALADRLGRLSAGVFDGAAMHTPVEATERALAAMDAAGADCTVALGGGSTTGLGKAIAYRRGTPQVAIPTTYAGSEVTPILGQTEGGRKTTVRGPEILPEVVLYDPDLTLSLPPALSVTSAFNAMAHAAEAVYAKDRDPLSSLMAAEGVRAFAGALPDIVASPRDSDARARALYGAWLCGTVLGTVGMALHHKLCHVLGGSFDLPHAETHTAVLPHAVAYNEPAAGEELAPIARALGDECAGAAFHALAVRLGAPTALRDLGLAESDLDRAADIAMAAPYWNPRPLERGPILDLLRRAWEGAPPRT
jgi:maleylacetate reductase